jgi:hypothetical protein
LDVDAVVKTRTDTQTSETVVLKQEFEAECD